MGQIIIVELVGSVFCECVVGLKLRSLRGCSHWVFVPMGVVCEDVWMVECCSRVLGAIGVVCKAVMCEGSGGTYGREMGPIGVEERGFSGVGGWEGS